MPDDEGIDEPLLLAECWQYWAERCAALSAEEWTAPTRCAPWDVTTLVDHVAPEPAALEQLGGLAITGEAAITDAAVFLREFDRSGAIAKAILPGAPAAGVLDSVALVHRFVDGAGIVLAEPELPAATVVDHPIVGATTVGVLTTVAIVEATVHYLDLLAAVGGEPLPPTALEYVLAVVMRMSEPAPLLEALTGRRNPLTWFPLTR